MKIALIHSIYRPYRRGGAEVVVETITAGLRALGHELIVITVGYQTAAEETEGIKIYRVKPFNLFNFLDINKQPLVKRFFWHLLDIFNCVQTRRIDKILKQERPDLVWGHNLKGLGYQVPRLVKNLKINYLQTIHDMQYLHPSGLLADSEHWGPGARLYAWFCRRLLDSPELVIFPSQFIKNIYDRHGFFSRSRQVVLGNPLASLPAASSPVSKATLNFLYLGQMGKYKGIIELAEAFKELRGDIILNIVGEGNALEKVKTIAKDDQRIRFWGHLKQEDLEKNIWPQTDLLINPSQVAESFGLVVLEAFSHGIPAVATAIGALPELVVEGQTGWLVPPVDKEALKNKLQEIIDQRLITEEIKRNCLNRAKDFELDNYLNKILSLTIKQYNNLTT